MTFEEAHRRIKRGDVDALRAALDAGLDPSQSNFRGWSLLMLAALSGVTEIGLLLVSRGAPLDSTNQFGETALSLAAHKGLLPFVRMMVENGASKDCRPHGHELDAWIRLASGLPPDKISEILHAIDANRYSH